MVSAYLLVNNVVGSVWLALVVGTLMGGLLGLLVGWLAVRRIGIYFAMITLAFGQMAYFLSFSPLSAYTGGENGLPGVPFPRIGGYRIVAGQPMYCAAGYSVLRRLSARPPHPPFAVRPGAARDQGEHRARRDGGAFGVQPISSRYS